MSPVQPSRSSRCGQSVGTSRKLPRSAPHHVAVELVEQLVGALERADPRAGRSARRRPRASVGGELARPAVDLDVAEAVEGERRLEDVLATAEDEAVGRLARRAAAGCPARRARAPRRAARVIVATRAGPARVNRSQPTRFCPKSTRVRAGRGRSRSAVRAASASWRGTGGPDRTGPAAPCRTSSARTGGSSCGGSPGRTSGASRRRASIVWPS